MKGSILIFGSTQSQRNNFISEIIGGLNLQKADNPDVLTVEKPENRKSIGIEQIRQMKKFVYEKPFENKDKAVIIKKADLLTTQAQNALLKTLEEPPHYATIVLSAKTEDSVLETIVSRCKRINVAGKPKIKDKYTNEKIEEVGKVLNMTPGERLAWAEEFSKKDSEEIVEVLENWAIQLHDLSAGNPTLITTIQKIATVSKDIEKTNINTKLAVERLVLNL